MPTYSYACTACGHRFDAQQSFEDPALTECPECAGRLRKLFSAVGVVFKGSGFYRTDSRAAENGSRRSGRSGEGGTGGDSSGKDGSKDSGSTGATGKDSAKDGGISGGAKEKTATTA